MRTGLVSDATVSGKQFQALTTLHANLFCLLRVHPEFRKKE